LVERNRSHAWLSSPLKFEVAEENKSRFYLFVEHCEKPLVQERL